MNGMQKLVMLLVLLAIGGMLLFPPKRLGPLQVSYEFVFSQGLIPKSIDTERLALQVLIALAAGGFLFLLFRSRRR
ncbi:MAG: hypothetical protein HY423_03975 [Candidatus Lambdaproteobacteria bacterium]|nr:hypothetical protein [Candidatus Lambdaproteobacteria bacterium]